ncbi:twin-arginine translocase TatA/TatE family subunit [Propioniferax innocua]|uniref:Sec-independent protein translocase protein TatA n=1 Tax=Propioniferax innocua TaxID=1753 RepID=A0A542Z7E0_9ACTN|nr:twin-arginine translocase TatA/TatE family subunit [Propioniferax innocua]TQL56248.1 TatA/E family protein of Tat protein translocase [Propioniferax innocua]
MESTFVPLVLGLGMQELVIILLIALLLFGGSRLAGIGKSSGRAIREFKEETRGLREDERRANSESSSDKRDATAGDVNRGIEAKSTDGSVDAEVVESETEKNSDELR